MKNLKYKLLLPIFVLVLLFVSCESKIENKENLQNPIVRVYVDIDESSQGDAGGIYVYLREQTEISSSILASLYKPTAASYISADRDKNYVEFAIEKDKVYTIDVHSKKPEYVSLDSGVIVAKDNERYEVHVEVKKANVLIKSYSDYLLSNSPDMRVSIGKEYFDIENFFDYKYEYVEPGKYKISYSANSSDVSFNTNVSSDNIEIKDGNLTEIELEWTPIDEAKYTSLYTVNLAGNEELYKEDSSLVEFCFADTRGVIPLQKLYSLSLKHDPSKYIDADSFADSNSTFIEELREIPRYGLALSNFELVNNALEDGSVSINVTPIAISTGKKVVFTTLCGSPIKMNVGHMSVVGNETLYAETEDMMDAQGAVNVKEIYAITAVSSDGTPKNAFYKVNQKMEFEEIKDDDTFYVEVVDLEYEVLKAASVSFRIEESNDYLKNANCLFLYIMGNELEGYSLEDMFIFIDANKVIVPVGLYSVGSIEVDTIRYEIVETMPITIALSQDVEQTFDCIEFKDGENEIVVRLQP